MDPTVRLLELLGLLQRRPEWSAAQLADHLGVTTRTVRRDITRLRALGYAVDAGPGRGGGYRLRAGTVLPPLVLTDDEAVALAVGLRAAALSGVSGSGEVAVSAASKLEGLLPSRLRRRIGVLGADVISLSRATEAGTDPTVLVELALACHQREQVVLAYTDVRGVDSRREVDPYRVVHTGQRWYLAAYDHRRAAWRTFRIDRVRSVELRGGRVRFVDPPDAAALVAEAVTTAAYTWTALIHLDLPLAEARRRVAPSEGQLSATGDSGSLLRLGANDLDWLARYLVGLTCGLRVLEPPQLLEAFAALGQELVAFGASRPTRPDGPLDPPPGVGTSPSTRA